MVCIEAFTTETDVITPVGPPLQNADMSNVNSICQARCFANARRFTGRLTDTNICSCTKYASETSHIPSRLNAICEQRCSTHNMVYTGKTIQKDTTATLCACSYDKTMAVKGMKKLAPGVNLRLAPSANLAPGAINLGPAPKERNLTADECVYQDAMCMTKAYLTYWDPAAMQCANVCASTLGKPYLIEKGWTNKIISIPENHMLTCRTMSGPNVIAMNDPIITKDEAHIYIDDNQCNQWTVTKV